MSCGGRQDSLTFGRLDGGDPFFRLTLYRVGRESVPDVPLFIDLVRLAASIDLAVTRSANPANLPTRFGPFETADIDLAAGAAAPVPCLGFRGAGLEWRLPAQRLCLRDQGSANVTAGTRLPYRSA